MPVASKHEHLVAEWKKTYDEFCESEFAEETDFQNFCWGWCMAKGLNTDEAFEFYNAMIDLEIF